MTARDKPLCLNCRFWERQGHELRGLCRRRAPVITEFTAESYDLWPTTSEGDWCGDFYAFNNDQQQAQAHLIQLVEQIHARIV